MNTYWNRNGVAQAIYDEMEAADFKYTQATERAFHSYYRYYNDGDLPGWARSRWDITKQVWECGWNHRVLTEKGEEGLKEVYSHLRDWNKLLTAGFTEEELEIAHKLISRMEQNVSDAFEGK